MRWLDWRDVELQVCLHLICHHSLCTHAEVTVFDVVESFYIMDSLKPENLYIISCKTGTGLGGQRARQA